MNLREGNDFTPVCDSVHEGKCVAIGGMHCRGVHARDTAIEAGGMQPIGMHSCCLILSEKK